MRTPIVPSIANWRDRKPQRPVEGNREFRFANTRSRRPRRRALVAAGAVILATSLVMTMAMVAAASATHQINLTLNDATVIVRVRGGTTAGVFSGSPFGSGAIVQRIRVTSASGSTVKTQSTFTIFTANGSLTGLGGSTRTTHPDGGISIIATRSITGGTGAYHGAAGHLIVTGTRTTHGVATTHWVGNVRY